MTISANKPRRWVHVLVASALLLTASLPGRCQSEESQTVSTGTRVLKGQATYCVPRGTPFKLKLSTVPSSGLRMAERDLDGNWVPAKLGEEVTAKTVEDLYVDNNKVIPEGTEFHGKVSKILPPRTFNRPGSLEIAFDELKTPDGRRFAFKADANNFHPSTTKSKLQGAGRITYHAACGAILGAAIAYQICGPHLTASMHGYNIAGAAGAGAILAAGFAIADHGHKAYLEPGDDLNMSFDADLLMPAAVDAGPKKVAHNLSGLQIQIKKSKIVHDGLDGEMLRLDTVISNDSDRLLKSIDLFVEDANGNRYGLCAGPDAESSEFFFEVEPHTEKVARLYFPLQYPKLKRQLVWLNHRTRQICYRMPTQ